MNIPLEVINRKITLKSRVIEVSLITLVVVVVSFVAILHYRLTDKERWLTPPGYADDSLGVLAMMKAANTGDFHPFQLLEISNLGAPYSANWNDFPVTDPILWKLGGILSKYFGLEIAANILLLVAHAVTALLMYACLRWVLCSRIWSSVFAICFGLCPYLFHRGFTHIVLTYSESVPMICAVGYLLFKHGCSFLRKQEFILFCFISFYLGIVFPYYTAVYLQVLLAALVSYFVNEKKLWSSSAYFVLLAIVLAGFTLQIGPTLLYSLEHGKNYFAIDRAYENLQVAALRPIELFLPGSDSHIPGLRQLSVFYENQDMFRKNFKFSESMAAYMGIVGCGAFFALICSTLYQIISRKQQSISGWFWFVLWFFAFSVVGGLNGVVGLAKIYFFRSSDRMSIFILAGSLFFLAQVLTNRSKNWNKGITLTLAALITAMGIYEALPQPLFSPRSASTLRDKVDADKAFFQSIEKSLPRGSMLFNYPVIQFPESGTYAHLRPYLWSQNLRFSFGSVKGRAREQWQQEIEALPAAEMVEKLQEYGFAGILVYNGSELEPRESAKVSRFLSEMGKLHIPSTQSSGGEFQLFMVTPVSNPTLPPVNPLFTLNWWGEDIQPKFPDIFYGTGFGLRWANQKLACLEVFNEQKRDRTFILKGRIISQEDSSFQIETKDKLLWSLHVPAKQFVDFETQPLILKPGEAVFSIRSSANPSLMDGRKFSFGVDDLQAFWK